MSTMWKVIGVMGLGAMGGALIYNKMQNKECLSCAKDTLNNITKKTSNAMKNMME